VSQIANKIWYIENKQIKEYPGTFEEYEYWRKKNDPNGQRGEDKPVKKEMPSPVKKESTSKNDETEKKLKVLTKELKQLESQIESLETEKSALENEMAKPEVYADFEKLKQKQDEFNATIASLEKTTKSWEDLVEDIGSLQI
jgi:ATP-binding cassette subfamily F protein 3